MTDNEQLVMVYDDSLCYDENFMDYDVACFVIPKQVSMQIEAEKYQEVIDNYDSFLDYFSKLAWVRHPTLPELETFSYTKDSFE